MFQRHLKLTCANRTDDVIPTPTPVPSIPPAISPHRTTALTLLQHALPPSLSDPTPSVIPANPSSKIVCEFAHSQSLHCSTLLQATILSPYIPEEAPQFLFLMSLLPTHNLPSKQQKGSLQCESEPSCPCLKSSSGCWLLSE